MTKAEQTAIESVKAGECYYNTGRRTYGHIHGRRFWSLNKNVSQIVLSRLYNKKIITEGERICVSNITKEGEYKLKLNDLNYDIWLRSKIHHPY